MLYKKQNIIFTNFEWMLVGLLIYSIGVILPKFGRPTCYLGLIIILYNFIFQRGSHEKPFTGFIQGIFVFYLIWTVYVFIRPLFSGEFLANNDDPLDRYLWLSYLTPLIVFSGMKNLSLKSVFNFCYIYGILGIVLLILNYQSIFAVQQVFNSDEYQDYIRIAGIPTDFIYATSFLVLCYSFIKVKYRALAFFAMVIGMTTVAFTARRTGIFMYILIFVFFLYLYLFSSEKGHKKRKLIFVILILFIGIVIFSVYENSTFSLLLSRLEEDSRSGVEQYFFSSFNGNISDWMFGRGINGTYYYPFYDTNNRNIIETGYLYIILKGGIIHLALFVYFLLSSTFLGLFRTNNMLTKAMAFYLFAHVLFLYPFGLPAFTLEYVIVWICVIYCQSKTWRMKTNEEIFKCL